MYVNSFKRMGRGELSHDLVSEVAAGLKDFDCIVAGPDLGRDPHSSGYFLAVLYSKCKPSIRVLFRESFGC
ncbi:hypothetical protein MKW98_023370 [Papaver atlanticum]|uniref:Uncharacterized protein n=1 Tax=Papaver atlanticum TaxID=357466 RepID=A0AAD4XM80_9MAGN|nr:hypothetical protein MKW98_023370 [Papaver atlanticum]